MREIDTIVVHCADTPPGMDVGAAEIRDWHKQRGWSDIGYHWVIRRNGTIEPGRDLDRDGDIEEEIGAHVLGHNARSLGICMAGGKSSDGRPDANFTAAQWYALFGLVKLLKGRHPDATVVGHRDLNPGKACPCFDVRAWWGGSNDTALG